MSFLNPYHFIPVIKGQRRDDLPIDELGKDGTASAVTHAEYVPGTYSGRLLCRLTTETECFVGAARQERAGAAAEVQNFFVDGRPAVPASSLRGMVSSIAEAASNSALRVLGGQPYSFRRAMDPAETLSAVGMIRTDGKGSYFLMPLSLPTLTATGQGSCELPPEYRPLFPEPLLKTYVGDFGRIRQPNFGYTTFNAGQPDWFYTKLYRRQWSTGYKLTDDQYQNRKPASRRFLVSQFAMDGKDPKRQAEIDPADGPAYTAGVMRVLGCWGARAEGNLIPRQKKHELFLPWPQTPNWPLVGITKTVVDRFHALCDERTEASKRDAVRLPLEPAGTLRNTTGNRFDERFRLKDGDLVFFKAAVNERKQTFIAEISLSSIWRGEVVTLNGQPASAWDFFGAVDENLLPFHRGRKIVTMAEQMFGFVEDEKPRETSKDDRRPGAALASRIRFSSAVTDSEERAALLAPVTLKILSSPKPPSPSMYFKNAKGRAGTVRKRDLTPGDQAGAHLPQGRKMYLHHTARGEPWRTANERENAKQKSVVRPLRRGIEFKFHVDFDNLSSNEMGLLLFALRPTEAFRHKLGMGKPLGLGTVKLDVVAYLEIDRQVRYSYEGLFAPRYRRAHVAVSNPGVAVEDASEQCGGERLESLRAEHRTWLERVSPDIMRALVLLGEPSHITLPVHTPTVDGRPSERETFQWFVENERANQQQSLTPLEGRTQTLPALRPFGER